MQALQQFLTTHFAVGLADNKLKRQLMALSFNLYVFLMMMVFSTIYYVIEIDTTITAYTFCCGITYLGTFLFAWRGYHYASILYMFVCINIGFGGGMLLWGSPFEIAIVFLPLICGYFVLFDLKDKGVLYLVLLSITILAITRLFDWSSFAVDVPISYKRPIYISILVISLLTALYFINIITKMNNKTERRLELQSFAMDNAGDSILWLDKTGNVCYANKMAIKIFQYEKYILLQSNIFELCKDFSKQEWQNIWSELEKNKLMYLEHVFCNAISAKIDMDISFSMMNTGKEYYVCAFMKDISEPKRLEHVKQAEKKCTQKYCARL